MKSTTKKMFAFLLSVIMVLAMTVTAFAADEGTGTTKRTTANLNITRSENAPNATFKAYKVMSAKQVGEDLFTYTVEDAFKPFFENGANGYTLNGDNEILKDGKAVTGDGEWTNTNNTTAADLAAKLEKFAIQAGITAMNVPANDLPIGYYVVSETATADKAQVSSKPVLVNLVKDVNITPKDSKTTLEKNILEGDAETPVKENTASVGDEIKYEVTTSIPTYAANVDKTKLVFKLTDTFTRLDYQKNLEIYVGDDGQKLEKDTDYKMTKETNREFVAELTADAILAYQGKTLTLKYTAKLAEDAVIGSEGNPNDIHLEYTNNPNQENYTGTLDDKVKTYTYGFKIRKVDKNDETKDMAGAKFGIYDSTGKELGIYTYGENGTIEKAEGLIISDVTGNYATITGLKEGSYTIKELQAPNGYSILENAVVVTIEDVKTADGKLSGKGKLTLTQGSTSSDAVVEVNQSAGTASVDLVVKIFNVKGISLPETGAKTAMYCLFGGAALIVLGGLYFGLEKLFSRKRQ